MGLLDPLITAMLGQVFSQAAKGVRTLLDGNEIDATQRDILENFVEGCDAVVNQNAPMGAAFGMERPESEGEVQMVFPPGFNPFDVAAGDEGEEDKIPHPAEVIDDVIDVEAKDEREGSGDDDEVVNIGKASDEEVE